jgi:arginase family enzyme
VTAIQGLADRLDHLYLHVDSDILDERFQPNHPTAEPDGPDVETVSAAIRAAMATGKVRAYGVVSVNPEEPGGATSLASTSAMIVEGVRVRASQPAGV